MVLRFFYGYLFSLLSWFVFALLLVHHPHFFSHPVPFNLSDLFFPCPLSLALYLLPWTVSFLHFLLTISRTFIVVSVISVILVFDAVIYSPPLPPILLLLTDAVYDTSFFLNFFYQFATINRYPFLSSFTSIDISAVHPSFLQPPTHLVGNRDDGRLSSISSIGERQAHWGCFSSFFFKFYDFFLLFLLQLFWFFFRYFYCFYKSCFPFCASKHIYPSILLSIPSFLTLFAFQNPTPTLLSSPLYHTH